MVAKFFFLKHLSHLETIVPKNDIKSNEILVHLYGILVAALTIDVSFSHSLSYNEGGLSVCKFGTQASVILSLVKNGIHI